MTRCPANQAGRGEQENRRSQRSTEYCPRRREHTCCGKRSGAEGPGRPSPAFPRATPVTPSAPARRSGTCTPPTRRGRADRVALPGWACQPAKEATGPRGSSCRSGLRGQRRRQARWRRGIPRSTPATSTVGPARASWKFPKTTTRAVGKQPSPTRGAQPLPWNGISRLFRPVGLSARAIHSHEPIWIG